MRVKILVSNKISKFYSVDRDEILVVFSCDEKSYLRFEVGIVFELYALIRYGINVRGPYILVISKICKCQFEVEVGHFK